MTQETEIYHSLLEVEDIWHGAEELSHVECHKLLDAFIKKYDNSSIEKRFKTYKWKWTYNRKLNKLTFKPLKT